MVRGKTRQVHPLLYVVAGAFVLYFTQGVITKLVS
jgi:AGZA family xanthine/uracil permease-like MFS transporter